MHIAASVPWTRITAAFLASNGSVQAYPLLPASIVRTRVSPGQSRGTGTLESSEVGRIDEEDDMHYYITQPEVVNVINLEGTRRVRSHVDDWLHHLANVNEAHTKVLKVMDVTAIKRACIK